MQAYRLACHLGEEEDAVEGLLRQVSQGAFNRVLLFVLKEVWKGPCCSLLCLLNSPHSPATHEWGNF